MAITFIQTPQKYTPANNDILIQVQSDSLNLAYFLAEVKDSAGLIISTLKLRPTPLNKKGAFFNLVNVLSAQTTFVKSDNIIEYTNDVYKYSVRLTSYIINASGLIVASGEESVLSDRYIFNAELPLDEYSTYDYTRYACTSTGTGRFLTNKPKQCDMSPLTTEYLYYLNDARASKVRFLFNYLSGAVVEKTFNLDITKTMGRINISPIILEANSIDLTDLKYYTVDLLDASNLVAVHPVYRYINKTCSISNVQLFWTNQLGGIDSYLFKNLRESINNTKITVGSSPYKMGASNQYATYSGNVYNPTEVTLKSDTTSTYTVVSEYLNKDEAKWITTIITSKQVWILLENGKVYPIQIKDTGATIQDTRYTGSLNQFEVSFTAPSTGSTGLSLQMFTGIEYFPYVLPIVFI